MFALAHGMPACRARADGRSMVRSTRAGCCAWAARLVPPTHPALAVQPGGDNGPEYSDCARKVLAAKAKKGNAVLFHSIKPTGELVKHGGMSGHGWHDRCPE